MSSIIIFMNKRIQIITLSLVLTCIVLTGIIWAVSRNSKSENPTVVVSFFPLYEVARNILPQDVSVKLLAPVGVDVHDFEPTPQDVQQVTQARLFIYHGKGLDSWAEDVAAEAAARQVITFESADQVELLPLETEAVAEVEHKEGHDDHGNLDPHFWLDPMRMAQVARQLSQTVIDNNLADTQITAELTADYVSKLETLDADYRRGLAECQQQTLVVTHDAYGYLAKAYNLELIPITGIDGQGEPGISELQNLSNLVRDRGIGFVFTEELANSDYARLIAEETKAQLLTLHPIEGLTAEQQAQNQTYLDLMNQNLENIRLALACV